MIFCLCLHNVQQFNCVALLIARPFCIFYLNFSQLISKQKIVLLQSVHIQNHAIVAESYSTLNTSELSRTQFSPNESLKKQMTNMAYQHMLINISPIYFK